MQSTDEFQRLAEAIFQEAIELAPSERASFLARRCADEGLRSEVEELLRGCDTTDDTFLASPIVRTLPAEPGETPRRLGGYRIIRRIGEGGMGTVYEAEQASPRRIVALKVIREGYATPATLRRFEHEAWVLGQLHHPGIAQIYEAGAFETPRGRLPYFAMEYVDGKPLGQYAVESALSNRDRLELVARICDAAHHAHQKGVIHRDLKPGNILVREEASGRRRADESGSTHASDSSQRRFAAYPKILDFGVARLTYSDQQIVTMQTSAGELIGTIPYMSPEQVSGQNETIDARSDVYSLGVILYELLAGRLPYDLRNRPIPEAARIIRDEEPSRLGSVDRRLRGDIDTIVMKALEKEPARRYASAAALADDLRRYLSDEPVDARPASSFYQLRKFARRNRALVGGVFATLLALAVGLVATTWFALREHDARGRADDLAIESRRLAYRSSIAAAAAGIQSGDAGAALRSLRDAPDELRGWEWRHLEWVVSRGGRVTQASPGYRTLLARDASARFIAMGNDNGEAELWDMEAPRLLQRIQLASADGWTTAISRDGDRVLLRERNGITLRDRADWSIVWQVQRPAVISPEAFSPEGREIVLAEPSERRVVIVDSRDGAALREFKNEHPALTSAYFSPDGRWIRCWHHTLYNVVLEAQTGDVRAAEFMSYPGFTDDGRLLVPDWNGVREFDLERKTSTNHVREIGAFKFASVGRDGRQFLVGRNDGMLQLIDAVSARELWRAFSGGGLRWIQFTGDERGILAADEHGRVYRWPAVDFAAPFVVADGVSDSAECAALSPDSAHLAVSGFGRLSVFEIATGRLCWRAAGPRTSMPGIAWSEDGSRVLTLGMGGAAALFDGRSGRRIAMRWRSSPITALCAAAIDESEFLVSFNDGALRRLPVGATGIDPQWATDAPFARLPVPLATMRRSPASRELAGGAAAIDSARNAVPVYLFSPDDARVRLTIPAHRDMIRGVAFSTDGSQLASGSDDQTVAIWNTESGGLLWRIDVGVAVRDVVFLDGDRRVAAACADGSSRLFSAESGELMLAMRAADRPLAAIGRIGNGGMWIVPSWGYAYRLYEDGAPTADPAVRNRYARAWAALPELAKKIAAQSDSPGEYGSTLARLATNADVLLDLAPDVRIAALELASALGPDPATAFSTGLTALWATETAERKYFQVLELLKFAAEAYPGDYEVLAALALASARLGRHADALTYAAESDTAASADGAEQSVIAAVATCLAEISMGSQTGARAALADAERRIRQPGQAGSVPFQALVRECRAALGDDSERGPTTK